MPPAASPTLERPGRTPDHEPGAASGLAKEELLDLLESILRAHPDGLREYALYTDLKQRGAAPFANRDLSDSLVLFQVHFFLFHLLYLLQERCRKRGDGLLEIHCLEITLRPWEKQGAQCLERPDPLRDYYLDLRAGERTTRTQVDEMLNEFWTAYAAQDRRAAALAELGAPAQADDDQLRRRFRELAFERHPDRGGDPEAFRRLAEAGEVLFKNG